MKMSVPILKIFNTPEETARGFALFLTEDIAASEGIYTIALSGGSTPKILFRILAEEFSHKIDWQKVHFYWGDDRMVPAANPESNFGEAKRLLFDSVSVPENNIHAINGIKPVLEEAQKYSAELMKFLPQSNGLPRFSMMLLGMGDDGHTASIFPNQMYLLNSEKICEPAKHPESGQARVTMTGRVINNSEKIIFLVTGKNKSAKISEIINKKGNFLNYPSANISPTNGELYWFMDSDAAGEID